jgi:hypothetical protein
MDDSRTPEPEPGRREVQDAQPCGGVARSSPRCSKTEFYTSGQTDAPASQRGFLNNGPHGAHATLPTSLSRKPVAVWRHDEGTEGLCLGGRLSGFKGRDLPISSCTIVVGPALAKNE